MSAKASAASRIVIALFLLGLSAPGGICGPDGFSTTPYRHGEVLRYKVRYGPIRLGTLVISQDPADSLGRRTAVVRMEAQTAPGLPLIQVQWTNRSVVLPSYPSTRDFNYDSQLDGGVHLRCRYEASTREAVITQDSAGIVLPEIRRRLDAPGYDAGGVIMMMRCMSGSGMKAILPTLLVEDFRPTLLDFTREVEQVKVPAFDQPVRAVRFDGKLEWVLPTAAGLTGDIHGWLTPDEAAIPVKATAKIVLGSITLELESFERP
jgi:hypothetical protein